MFSGMMVCVMFESLIVKPFPHAICDHTQLSSFDNCDMLFISFGIKRIETDFRFSRVSHQSSFLGGSGLGLGFRDLQIFSRRAGIRVGDLTLKEVCAPPSPSHMT